MSNPHKHLERQLENLSALADPVRRSLYFHVLSRNDEVSRDEAARALRITRALAAFHLDKLADAGLLDVSFRRLSGRTGPGAGRPSKLYRRSALQIDVTLPARRYDLAARLLARAAVESGPEATKALENSAEAWGHQIGVDARRHAGAKADEAHLLRSTLDSLRASGFEPRVEDNGDIVLGNCPFDALMNDARLLICTMNLALCRGLLAGLEWPGWKVRFEPNPARCCVVFETRERCA
jgi:predicted ArsR family transcriptional regulator